EDLSDVLKAEKQAAWREVARRVAHEIKNPLTPIALSAERIQRHLQRAQGSDASLAIIASCAETIAGAVDTVRTLVDEFSALARSGGERCRRYRTWRDRGNKRKTLHAIFFNQAPWHRTGTGDREPHCRGASRNHSRGGKPAGGRALRAGAAGGAGGSGGECLI